MRWGRAILAVAGVATLAIEVYFIITQMVPLFFQFFIAQPANILSVLLYTGYIGILMASTGIAIIVILVACATEEPEDEATARMERTR
jgi:hypothetical protein